MCALWVESLAADPMPSLLARGDPTLSYFVKRDLLGDDAAPAETLWEIDTVVELVKKQQPNGAWRYPGISYNPSTGTNYNLLETYRSLRVLVEMYSMDIRHPAIQWASDYVFSFQTDGGDIRGILGNQYMPYYHGATLELLVKAGCGDDPRVVRGLEWLLSARQADGGWVVPAQLLPAREKTSRFWLGPPLPPDRSKPSSHLATGMVLRAFAAHPDYRNDPDVVAAARLLKGRMFKADKYSDRKAPSYWLKFQYPFWWTSLLTALDTLSYLGFDRRDEEIERGLAWFLENQSTDGLWGTGYGLGKSSEGNRRWVGLAACRMIKRYWDSPHNK